MICFFTLFNYNYMIALLCGAGSFVHLSEVTYYRPSSNFNNTTPIPYHHPRIEGSGFGCSWTITSILLTPVGHIGPVQYIQLVWLFNSLILCISMTAGNSTDDNQERLVTLAQTRSAFATPLGAALLFFFILILPYFAVRRPSLLRGYLQHTLVGWVLPLDSFGTRTSVVAF